ncbi:MAG: hypothetical protein GY751_12930 [Bacteroidetes bacterium]|nr:hypothetical protein [Bacteroidota bacterium]
MTKEEEFIKALKSNVKEGNKFPSIIQAVVVEAGDTFCKVKLTDNDLELEEVMYSATEENENGFILIPKENTNVLIGTIGGGENSLYIVAMDEVQKVKLEIESTTLTIDMDGTVFNAGNNGGLVISEKVTDEINALKQEINSLKQAITTWIPVPQDGGAAFKAAASS